MPKNKKKKEFQYVICKNDKWISFVLNIKSAKKAVKEFNAWLSTQDRQTKSNYGNRQSSLERDYSCQLCGSMNPNNFRLATKEETDRIYGSTISPVAISLDKLKCKK